MIENKQKDENRKKARTPDGKKTAPSDEQLQIAARYFVYHLRMYIDTLVWLQEKQNQQKQWDTIRNAMLEAHLIHCRVLIFFLWSDKPRDGDVNASDYFSDTQYVNFLSRDDYLQGQAKNIGGQLVHLTTNAMPKLKSEQDWPLKEIVERLVPHINKFLDKVAIIKFPEEIKIECRKSLNNINSTQLSLRFSAST